MSDWRDVFNDPAKDQVDLAREGLVYDEDGQIIPAAEGTAAHQPALAQYEEAQNLADAWHDYDTAEAIWAISQDGDEASL